MPWNRSLYPANWRELATAVKDEAHWRCQECRRPCRRPGERWEEFRLRLSHINLEEEKPGRFVLTVAHLDHRPENSDRANLRALCTVCHCRYDLSQMALKRHLKLERMGQLNLLSDRMP